MADFVPPAPQPQTIIIVHDDMRRHRCTCCCCACCKIHIACIVIMALEVIGVAVSFKWAADTIKNAHIFKEEGLPWLVGVQGTNLFVNILLLVGIGFAAYAIRFTKPKMVYPHIVAQGIQLVYTIIAMIVTAVEVFAMANDVIDEAKKDLNEEANTNLGDDFNEQFGREINRAIKQVKVELNTTFTVLILIASLIFISFSAWFIYLFFQLKRYLEEQQTKIPGNYERQIDGAELNNSIAPPPEYKV